MAAYAALVSLAQTIDEYHISLLQKGQITSIREHLISVKAFFEEFPEKSNDILEARIRDIALETEDRITHSMLNPSVGGDEWNKLSDTINSIAREVKDLCLGDDDDDSLPPPAAASSSSSLAPSHGKDAMVGFDGDLLAIKERLCGQSSKLQVIPIVGMGGIGKTTLALNAYNDPSITERFDIRAWATLSQDYSVSKIISDLQIGGSGQSNELNVYKTLKGRRYLIVMDDIWSTKAWDDVKMIFPDDNNGSRIMLTTRLTDVAAYANSSSPLHEMHLMDVDRSWDLLRQKVFTDKDCPPELKHIGKKIAGSCRGLPLAIVVIAGLLSTVSKTPAEWKKIAKNVKSAIAREDGQIDEIMSFSYTLLPHHLRACFLFMGAYPEDHKINVSNLIKLWVAEGFIKPSESKNLEEMAEEYLEDLVRRFLVLVSEKKSNGKIKSCRLHDIIRELCLRKAEQEKLLLYVRDATNLHEESTRNQRRLTIIRRLTTIKQSHDLSFLAKFYGSTIRTLMCFVSGENPNMYSKYFRFLDRDENPLLYSIHFRSLRVTHFENTFNSGRQSARVAQMFELFHLRYLAFRFIKFNFSIPAAITDLQHLQTLIINSKQCSDKKVSLPSGIWRMRQLRHLVCYQIAKLPNPEEGAICGLENLQTLLEVRNFKCSKSIMRMVPGVKKLGIVCRGKDFVGCKLENLLHLQHLEKLKITVGGYAPVVTNVNLAFPRRLKKLSLDGLGLPWDRDMMKIVGSLPHLQVLKLKNSRWKRWETSGGEFLELKYLLIEGSSLEEWITESSHFPRLECLMLNLCFYLFKIPDGIGEIPTLELIELNSCRKSAAESAKRIQEEQQSYGNDALQVVHRSCFNISLEK